MTCLKWTGRILAGMFQIITLFIIGHGWIELRPKLLPIFLLRQQLVIRNSSSRTKMKLPNVKICHPQISFHLCRNKRTHLSGTAQLHLGAIRARKLDKTSNSTLMTFFDHHHYCIIRVDSILFSTQLVTFLYNWAMIGRNNPNPNGNCFFLQTFADQMRLHMVILGHGNAHI